MVMTMTARNLSIHRKFVLYSLNIKRLYIMAKAATTSSASSLTNLDELRVAIDSVDDRILGLLSERVAIVKQVGELKRRARTEETKERYRSIIRPGREANMVRRIAEKGDKEYPKAALAHIWRLIISSAIHLEEETRVSTVARTTDPDAYWIAREYFGAFTPHLEHPYLMDVVHHVEERKSSVGVLPLWDNTSAQAWWSRILEDNTNHPKIFARLPFVRTAPSEKSPLVAIGYVDPEPTGEDESLWVVKAEDTIATYTIEKLLKKVGFEFAIQGQCRVFGTPSRNHFLLCFPGFVDEHDERITNFLDAANGPDVDARDEENAKVVARHLGSYATPVILGERA